MLRTFGAFLLLFWAIGLSVHLEGVIHVFAVIGIAFFAIDFLLKSPNTSRVRGGPIL
jgi:hypothetical protein